MIEIGSDGDCRGVVRRDCPAQGTRAGDRLRERRFELGARGPGNRITGDVMEDGSLDAVHDLQGRTVGEENADPRPGIRLLPRHIENQVGDFVAVKDVVQQPAGKSPVPDRRACSLEFQAQNSFGTSCTLN